MKQTTPPADQDQFAHASSASPSLGKRIFRFIRWTTYALALVTFVLVFHRAPPPLVETSPQAAARAEEKLDRVERAVANGQPATLHMDETELNSYLASHLALAGNGAPNPAPAGGAQGAPNEAAPTPQEVEQMRSNVRDVKVQLIDDRVKAYVVFDVHGKDTTLQLEGRLGAQNGYLHVRRAAAHGLAGEPREAEAAFRDFGFADSKRRSRRQLQMIRSSALSIPAN